MTQDVSTRAAAALLALSIAAAAPTAVAEQTADLDQRLERLEGEFSDAAREAIERFLIILGPLVERMTDAIDELPAYEAPEVLPNGDIIIRRRRPVPVEPPEIETRT